jgi:hypothetical protein
MQDKPTQAQLDELKRLSKEARVPDESEVVTSAERRIKGTDGIGSSSGLRTAIRLRKDPFFRRLKSSAIERVRSVQRFRRPEVTKRGRACEAG